MGAADLTISSIGTNLLKGLKNKHYQITLSKNAPKAMADLRLQAKRYINAKEELQSIEMTRILKGLALRSPKLRRG